MGIDYHENKKINNLQYTSAVPNYIQIDLYSRRSGKISWLYLHKFP